MLEYPKSWKNVSVSQFIELFSENVTSIKNADDYNMAIMAILCGIGQDEIDEMDYSEFQTIIKELEFVKTLPNRTPKVSIITDGGTLYLYPNLNNLTIGEFVDLETFFKSDPIKNLPLILGILYRQKIKSENLLIPDGVEPYNNWLQHRKIFFENLPIIDVYGVINLFNDFRLFIFDTYSGLFQKVSSDLSNESDEIKETIIQKAERLKLQSSEKLINKWGWLGLVLRLANDDIIKFEEASKLPLLLSLNLLSMKKAFNL